MNNNDERDYEEERYNKELIEQEDSVEATAEVVDWERELTESLDDWQDPMSDWIFTFGVGHKLVVYLPEMHDRVETQEGFSLAGYYFRIKAADEIQAREKFIQLFGHNWCSTYPVGSFQGRQITTNYKELKFS